MSKRNLCLLLHPLFLVSIGLLLLNDVYLKYAFSNWFTGKLSDFAGLFAFAVFLFAFFPNYKKEIIWFCALLFIWWKSPLSHSLINNFNALSPIPIGRTIDYTDFLALIVLAVAYVFIKPAFISHIQNRVLLNVVCIISLFAFCNTSAPRYGMYYVGQENFEYYGTFRSSKSENEILSKIRSLGISFFRDSIVYYPLKQTFAQNQLYSFKDSATQWALVLNKKDSSLFYKRGEEPFYIIPEYSLEGHQILNLKLRIIEYPDSGKKRTTIKLNIILQGAYTDVRLRKLKRKFTEHFTKLFL